MLFGGDATLAPGDAMTLIPGVVKNAAGNSRASSGSSVVLPPLDADRPRAVLAAPTTLGPCDGVALDASASEGGGGRALQVSGMDGGGLSSSGLYPASQTEAGQGGDFGKGGDGIYCGCGYYSGGGGGGWYGGGSYGSTGTQSGSGGSSYYSGTGVTQGATVAGQRVGDGEVTISW